MKRAETIVASVGEEIDPVALEAEGGEAPYRWEALEPLPEGLTLSRSGILYGLPTAAPGTYVIPVQVVDEFGEHAEGEIVIALSVEPLEIKTDGLPSSVTLGVGFSFAVEATGGVPPYQWALIGASGMSISADGVITGTISIEGTYTFVIQVTDDVGTVKRVNASIEVKAS